MVHFKFLILEEGLEVTKASVWAKIQKYKRHGTISHLPGSGWPTDHLVMQFVSYAIYTCHLVIYAYVLMITY